MTVVTIVGYEPEEYDYGHWLVLLPGRTSPVRCTNIDPWLDGAKFVGTKVEGRIIVHQADLGHSDEKASTLQIDAKPGAFKVNANGIFRGHGDEDDVFTCCVEAELLLYVEPLDPETSGYVGPVETPQKQSSCSLIRNVKSDMR